MNEIEFAIVGDGAVDVVVDGISLCDALLCAPVAARDFPALYRLWRGGRATTPADYEAPEGFVPLLTCGCGIFECGGKTMIVRPGPHDLVWADISGPWGYQEDDGPVDIGPFSFSWENFERAERVATGVLAGRRSNLGRGQRPGSAVEKPTASRRKARR